MEPNPILEENRGLQVLESHFHGEPEQHCPKKITADHKSTFTVHRGLTKGNWKTPYNLISVLVTQISVLIKNITFPGGQ